MIDKSIDIGLVKFYFHELDETLNNNEMTFWVTEQSGASLLNFKVKDSLGTVKKGNINIV
jgi:hypothetical protein